MKDQFVEDHMHSLESILADTLDNFSVVSYRMNRAQAEELKEQVTRKYAYLKAEIIQEDVEFFSVIVSETVTQTQQEVNP